MPKGEVGDKNKEDKKGKQLNAVMRMIDEMDQEVNKNLIKRKLKENQNQKGYGQISGKDRYAHRMAYKLLVGPIPKGICVCHKCDNPPCVNPEHLFLGTLADNRTDAHNKGRLYVLPKLPRKLGEENNNSKLTWVKVGEIRALLGKVSHKELGKRYGVSSSLISLIRNNKIWVI